jgi:hypothetical protein
MVLTGTPVSSTNKTDRNDITEILLKVALNTTKSKQLQQLGKEYAFAPADKASKKSLKIPKE